MPRKYRLVPSPETLDARSLPAIGTVNTALLAAYATAVETAKSAVPDAVPSLIEGTVPAAQVGFSVETDIPLVRQLSPSQTTGGLNGVVPPVSADLLSKPADFAALGLSSLNGVVPPIFTDAVSRPIDFSQVDTDQPQRVGGTVTSLYPLTAQDVYVGFLEVPHSGTRVGLDNNGLTSGDVGLAADAIEADLGGAGLEV